MRRFAFLFVLFFAPAASAQTSLDAYRDAVTEYSRSLKRAAAQTDEAAETMGRARTGFLPQLSLDGSFTATVHHYEGLEQWTFGVLPQFVQLVYGGGAVRAGYRRAALGYDIALCDYEFTLHEVRYAADYAYWNLSASELYAAAMREYVGLIRSLKRVIDDRFREGYIAKGDVLMIETRLIEAEYEQTGAEKNREVALHNFNILRGADADTQVALLQSIRDTLAPPQREAWERTIGRRSDYRAALLRTDQAAEGIRLAEAPFLPQVSVGIGGSWQPYVPNRTGETTVDGSAFVKLSVPIFHWGERRRAAGAARAVRAQTEWQAAALSDAIRQEEMNGWTAVVKSLAQVETTERSLRLATENLDLSTYSYGEGLTTILDVLQAQVSWIQLYSNAIRARYNYAVAVSDYRRITEQ